MANKGLNSLLLIAIGMCVIHETEPRIYSRCELAMELYKIHGVIIEDVPTLVCLAYHVSHYSTAHHRGRENGLFGLSDGYWCSVDTYGAGCHMLCNDLRDDSISDDITCVKQVLRAHQKTDGNGFLAWGDYYRKNCMDSNVTLNYIEGCF